MRFEVLLTEDANRDLEEIHAYIAAHDAPGKADALLDGMEQAIENLARFAHRGSYPRELLALGIREYRQKVFKSYRLIYRVIEQKVYVYVIADGRRDFQTLLARRLLGA